MVATLRLDRSKCRQLDNHRVWVFWDHGEEGEKHRTGLVCGLALVDNYDVDDPTIDFGVVAVDERATEADYRFEDELIVLRDAAGWSREVPVCWMNVRLADGDVLVIEDDPRVEHVALARRLAIPLTSGEVLDYLHSVNRLCQRRPQEFATDYRWSSYRRLAEGAADRVVTPHALYSALGRTPAERQQRYADRGDSQLGGAQRGHVRAERRITVVQMA